MPTLQHSPVERESTTDDSPTTDASSPDGESAAPFPYGDTFRGESIARDTGPILVSAGGNRDRVDSTTCPSCGGDLVNGAGLFVCPDCE